MTNTKKKYVVVLIFLVFGIGFWSLFCINKTILAFQNTFLGLEKIYVGNAVITKDHNWMLSSHRESRNSNAVIFGLLPESMAMGSHKPPEGIYYIFYNVDGCNTYSEITFTEIEDIQLDKVKKVISRNSYLQPNDNEWEIVKVGNWDILVLHMPNDEYSVTIPELRLNILTDNRDVIKELSFMSRN